MNEPIAGLGEASHDVSPISISSNDQSLGGASHEDMPGHVASDLPRYPSPPPHHRFDFSSRRTSMADNHSLHGSPPPQALEQLANTLRLQSLALKSQTSETSSFLIHDHATQPLEADDREEEMENDPIYQKYQEQLALSANPLAPQVASNDADTEYLRLAVDQVKNKRAVATVHRSDAIPADFTQLGPILADTMDTDEGLEEPSHLVQVMPDHTGLFAPHKLLGPGYIRRSGDPLFFRRSAQAAALCPLVVHKTARMRKRTKSTMRNAILPKEGEKGKAVAAQLSESACSSR